MLLVAIFWIWYQRTFAYSHGMDSMEPEFEKVWMGLWRVHMIVMPIFAIVTWGWIWKTRDRDLDNLDPKLEVKRYFYCTCSSSTPGSSSPPGCSDRTGPPCCA